MDEQIQNQVVQKSVELLEHKEKTGETPKKKSNVIFSIILFLLIFAVVFAVIYFLGTGRTISLPRLITTNPAVTKVGKESPELTQKTQIAKTLTAPALDTFLHWSSQAKTATNTALTAVDADKFDGKYITILLQGKIYSASWTSGADPYIIIDNYASQLKSLGWVIPDPNNSFLIFKTFRLKGISPSSNCGSANSYFGYKDEMVRIVTITVESQPCQAKAGSPGQSTLFTFFISDPTPISYFTNYLAKHSQ